jgi:hypothetical protein
VVELVDDEGRVCDFDDDVGGGVGVIADNPG